MCNVSNWQLQELKALPDLESNKQVQQLERGQKHMVTALQFVLLRITDCDVTPTSFKICTKSSSAAQEITHL